LFPGNKTYYAPVPLIMPNFIVLGQTMYEKSIIKNSLHPSVFRQLLVQKHVIWHTDSWDRSIHFLDSSKVTLLSNPQNPMFYNAFQSARHSQKCLFQWGHLQGAAYKSNPLDLLAVFSAMAGNVVVVPLGRGPAYSGPICWGLFI